MKKKNILFLLVLSLCICNIVHIGTVNAGAFDDAQTVDELKTKYEQAIAKLVEQNKDKVSAATIKKVEKDKNTNLAKIATASGASGNQNGNGGESSASQDNKENEQKAKEKPYSEEEIAEKEKAYEDAKANQQSTANKLLTATSIAAMGGGAMELAQGMAEKKADEAAEQDMSAYIETFRCTYANGKQVKGGPEPVELPGGNDSKLMSLRNEYITLAKDLKERKTALGMAPGIEAEEILDKAEMGLYDDENIGKTGGAYASLYRAKALNSEEDQKKLDAEKEATSKRIKGGAIALGAGAAVSIVGNSLINGKLGEKIKDLKEKKANGEQVDTADDKETIAVLKRGLKVSGLKLTEVNKVPWKKLDGIGAVKEYAQGINFGLIPHDEAMKITSMTTTEVVGELIEIWYNTQHENDTEETIEQNQLRCENPQSANDDITGTWNSNTCTCSSKSGKDVSWTEDAGCTYIQPEEDKECSDEEIKQINEPRAATYKKESGKCKIDTCSNRWTPNADGTKCECKSPYKLQDGFCLEEIDLQVSVGTPEYICTHTKGDTLQGAWVNDTCLCPYKKDFSVVWLNNTCKYTKTSFDFKTDDLTGQGLGESLLNKIDLGSMSSLLQKK